MLEKNADVNCCFLCSVIFIEYYSTMHCNEVLQACQVDPIYCDIFGAAERVLRYGLPINLRYIFKRVPALVLTHCKFFPIAPKESKKSEKERKSMLKVTANSWWKVRKPRTHFTLVICWVDIVLVPWDQPVHFKIALFSVAPVSDPKMRAMYHFIALGKVLPAN